MAEPSTRRTVRVIIEGRVQGVWFRGWTCETARELGLDGWVRNNPDGSVEAVFSGPDDAVARMLALCEIGPPVAKVRKVNISVEEIDIKIGFHTRY